MRSDIVTKSRLVMMTFIAIFMQCFLILADKVGGGEMGSVEAITPLVAMGFVYTSEAEQVLANFATLSFDVNVWCIFMQNQ